MVRAGRTSQDAVVWESMVEARWPRTHTVEVKWGGDERHTLSQKTLNPFGTAFQFNLIGCGILLLAQRFRFFAFDVNP